MKKLIIALMASVTLISAAMPVPVFAYQYGFESGASAMPGFGDATSNDAPVSPDPMSQNVRRNKDNSDLPPPYFYGSGDIPTDTSSPNHDNLPGSMAVSGGSAGGGIYGGSVPGGGVINVGGTASGTSTVSVSQTDGLLASTSTLAESSYNTEPKYNSDGTIGTLYIKKLKKTIKVYEGESLENMKSGIGHFSETSSWDGNCGFAGHNRGAAAYFSFVKDLGIGDEITYKTPYGSRTYEVYNKVKISETDYSGLGWSAENIISMITCVENERSLRWLVQARETRD